MCHFAMGLTHCYKTTVFFTFIINNYCAKAGHGWLIFGGDPDPDVDVGSVFIARQHTDARY